MIPSDQKMRDSKMRSSLEAHRCSFDCLFISWFEIRALKDVYFSSEFGI